MLDFVSLAAGPISFQLCNGSISSKYSMKLQVGERSSALCAAVSIGYCLFTEYSRDQRKMCTCVCVSLAASHPGCVDDSLCEPCNRIRTRIMAICNSFLCCCTESAIITIGEISVDKIGIFRAHWRLADLIPNTVRHGYKANCLCFFSYFFVHSAGQKDPHEFNWSRRAQFTRR